MKTIILAGGLGSRISEETLYRPKPLVELNQVPIIEHIMKIYSLQGFKDFVIAAGYLGHLFDAWRRNLRADYKVQIVDTGESTMTAGRILRCLDVIQDQEFFVTYGDGLANVNLASLIKTHRVSNGEVTLTAVKPPVRFGSLQLLKNRVIAFNEKDARYENWINGGFFIMNRSIGKMISGDEAILEQDVLPELASSERLFAHYHEGFWHPMDTLREKQSLEELDRDGLPPWFQF